MDEGLLETQDANPYRSPTQPSVEETALSESALFSIRHFTLITVSGCNLLGLINFFGYIGGLMLGPILAGYGARWTGLVVGGALILLCPIVDLVFRLHANPREKLLGLLSPYRGGSLFFIPVWLVCFAMFITAVVAICQQL